jgi:hypothetical protein
MFAEAPAKCKLLRVIYEGGSLIPFDAISPTIYQGFTRINSNFDFISTIIK